MAHLNMKSYVHGGSEVPLLFDTIGERLRLAAKMVIFEKENEIKKILAPRTGSSSLQARRCTENLSRVVS